MEIAGLCTGGTGEGGIPLKFTAKTSKAATIINFFVFMFLLFIIIPM
jgi:hypothetical protein